MCFFFPQVLMLLESLYYWGRNIARPLSCSTVSFARLVVILLWWIHSTRFIINENTLILIFCILVLTRYYKISNLFQFNNVISTYTCYTKSHGTLNWVWHEPITSNLERRERIFIYACFFQKVAFEYLSIYMSLVEIEMSIICDPHALTIRLVPTCVVSSGGAMY